MILVAINVLYENLQIQKVTTMIWLTVIEHLCHKWSHIFFMSYYRVCSKSNITGAICGAEVRTLPEQLQKRSVFLVGFVLL